MTIVRHRSFASLVRLLSCCLLFTACGDDDGPASTADTGTPPSDGGEPPMDMRSGGDDTGPPDTGVRIDAGLPALTVVVTGTIRNFVGRVPVEGLSVCVYELPDLPCATTAADGTFELSGVPAPADIRLTYQNAADGWQRTMLHVHTRATFLEFGLVAVGATLAEGLMMDAGITVDAERATVVFNTVDGTEANVAVADVGATLAPDDAQALAFITDTSTLSTELAATGTQGIGLFANVPPGPHTIRFSHPDRECTNTAGWPGSAPNEARIDVVGGWFVSTIAPECPAR